MIPDSVGLSKSFWQLILDSTYYNPRGEGIKVLCFSIIYVLWFAFIDSEFDILEKFRTDQDIIRLYVRTYYGGMYS